MLSVLLMLKHYLIFIVDFLVGQVGNCDLSVGHLPDLMFRSLVWFSCVQKISKGLVVDLHKAGGETVLKSRNSTFRIEKGLKVVTFEARKVTSLIIVFQMTAKILKLKSLPSTLAHRALWQTCISV